MGARVGDRARAAGAFAPIDSAYYVKYPQFAQPIDRVLQRAFPGQRTRRPLFDVTISCRKEGGGAEGARPLARIIHKHPAETRKSD